MFYESLCTCQYESYTLPKEFWWRKCLSVRIPTLPWAFIVRICFQKIYFSTICNVRMMSERIVVVRVPFWTDPRGESLWQVHYPRYNTPCFKFMLQHFTMWWGRPNKTSLLAFTLISFLWLPNLMLVQQMLFTRGIPSKPGRLPHSRQCVDVLQQVPSPVCWSCHGCPLDCTTLSPVSRPMLHQQVCNTRLKLS